MNALIVAGGSATAAGGSERGAQACAAAAETAFGPGYTHVSRSISRSLNTQEFWLEKSTQDGDRLTCRYDVRKDRAEIDQNQRTARVDQRS